MVNSVFVGEGTEQVVMRTRILVDVNVVYNAGLTWHPRFSSLAHIDGQAGTVSLCQTF